MLLSLANRMLVTGDSKASSTSSKGIRSSPSISVIIAQYKSLKSKLIYASPALVFIYELILVGNTSLFPLIDCSSIKLKPFTVVILAFILSPFSTVLSFISLLFMADFIAVVYSNCLLSSLDFAIVFSFLFSVFIFTWSKLILSASIVPKYFLFSNILFFFVEL